MKQVAANFGLERVAAPAFAGRNDVQMTGKSEMAASTLTNSEQILDRCAMRRVIVAYACNEALDSEAER